MESGSGWRRAVREYVVGMTHVKLAFLSAPWRREAYNRWGAAASEVYAPMPGDDLVPNPRLGYTRAIGIDAPPEAVWPWLVQIGQGRGGLYSYDALENLIGCRIHSADEILAEHQSLVPGDLVRLGPEGYPCFRVVEVTAPDGAGSAPNRAPGKIRSDIRDESSPQGRISPVALVLQGADPKPPHATPSPGSPEGATWQFVLRSPDGGRTTRLVVRQRLAYPPGQAALWHVVEPITFAMEREMLRGVKRRAERGR